MIRLLAKFHEFEKIFILICDEYVISELAQEYLIFLINEISHEVYSCFDVAFRQKSMTLIKSSKQSLKSLKEV